WRLSAVDILFAIVVTAGLDFFVVPGILLFTWLSLSGPVVELEGAGVLGSFKRSWALVRGHFWTVLAVLVPIALLSSALSGVVIDALPPIFGSNLVSDWIGEAASSVALSPLYAVAAVLLTRALGPVSAALARSWAA